MKYVRRLQKTGLFLALLGLAVISYVNYRFGWATSITEISIKATLQGLSGIMFVCTGLVFHGMSFLALAIKEDD